MVFHCKTFIRLSLLEIHLPPSFSFIKPGNVQCPPFIFTPIIPEHSKEETLSPPLTFQNIFPCVLPLCYCITLLLYLLLSLLHSLSLYTQWEKWNGNFSFFFLEVLTLITAPSFVYSSVFTDKQGLEVPRQIHTLLLLQPYWYPTLDLWPTATRHKVMKWMKFVSRNISFPDLGGSFSHSKS